VSAIAIVGSGMVGNPGIAGRIFRSVGKIHANIIMISQGSSQYNVSFVVRRNAAKNVVVALHDEFKLSEIT
jgi:aspartate kinase